MKTLVKIDAGKQLFHSYLRRGSCEMDNCMDGRVKDNDLIAEVCLVLPGFINF